MTQNEIVARWLDFPEGCGDIITLDYNVLHEAWVKFRDLKFDEDDEQYLNHYNWIRTAIVDSTITEAFDELCKGIIWAESLNKKV